MDVSLVLDTDVTRIVAKARGEGLWREVDRDVRLAVYGAVDDAVYSDAVYRKTQAVSRSSNWALEWASVMMPAFGRPDVYESSSKSGR